MRRRSSTAFAGIVKAAATEREAANGNAANGNAPPGRAPTPNGGQAAAPVAAVVAIEVTGEPSVAHEV